VIVTSGSRCIRNCRWRPVLVQAWAPLDVIREAEADGHEKRRDAEARSRS